jgi:Glycosyl hydrolase family 12/Cellulose binding domain
VVIVAVALAAALTGLSMSSAHAATTTLCASQTAPAGGGTYTIQNNEWGSSAAECITTDGAADFTVANSSISNSTSGAPGGYPSIFQGCHWGNCSSGGLSANPIQASAITSGKVATSWSTTQPGGSNDYDVAYDIWFNQTPTTSGQPNGAELMIWLNHNGPVQPFGSQVATGVSVGGRGYNVWFGNQGWNTISYTMTTPGTSVSGLDLAPIVADAMSRGYIQGSWYLIDIEAGFELWQGGAGLATNSFSVNLNGSAPPPPTTPPATTPPPTTAPPTTAPPTTPPAQGGSARCTYSVINSWPGGYQGQVVVANSGTTAISGWKLAWTFPGSQQISSLWNGVVTQSGSSVSVANASYDATISPGSSVTVGFTANGTSAAPSGLTLNGASC